MLGYGSVERFQSAEAWPGQARPTNGTFISMQMRLIVSPIPCTFSYTSEIFPRTRVPGACWMIALFSNLLAQCTCCPLSRNISQLVWCFSCALQLCCRRCNDSRRTKHGIPVSMARCVMFAKMVFPKRLGHGYLKVAILFRKHMMQILNPGRGQLKARDHAPLVVTGGRRCTNCLRRPFCLDSPNCRHMGDCPRRRPMSVPALRPYRFPKVRSCVGSTAAIRREQP